MSHRIPVPQTPQTLATIAKELADLAGNLRVVSELMTDNDVSTLGIPNHDQLMRAMDYFTKYTAEAQRALREERVRRGAFGVTKKKFKTLGRKKKDVSDSESDSDANPENTREKSA